MKLLIPLIIITSFFINACVIDDRYTQDDKKCHYKRVRIYDEKGRYKGYTEERVCE